MKLILLAATAMLAVPAFAQTTTAPAGTMSDTPPSASTPTTADPAQTADPAMTPAPAAPAQTNDAPMTPAPTTDGGAAMTPQSQPMPAQSGAMPADGATPMGGYQPSGAPMTGTMTPGVKPTFQAAPSPSEAFPAPAPLAKYPVCKKGQFDKCIQRGGK